MLKETVTKDKHHLFVIIIVAIGFFLRIWKVEMVPVSLFSDELDVGYQAYSIIKTGKDYSGNLLPLQPVSYADTRAPLYIYTSIPSVYLFGITPLGVRLPAIIFGALGILGMYLLVLELSVSYSNKLNSVGWKLAVLSAAILALSPWHIQYSRAAFEATMLLAFLLFGLYFFFKSITQSRYLWISLVLLVLTPWIYNTAKLFTPALLITLFLIWKKQVLAMAKPDLVKAILAGLVIGLPLIYSTFVGGGVKRANYISIFTDPTINTEVDYSILYDAQVRKVYGGGLVSKIFTRVVHNKFTFWGSRIVNNYITSFSSDFLFINGDPNLRHSIGGMGQFYKFEFIPLILGVVLFFARFKDKKIKLLILFWIVFAVLPSAITRDGGTHATRLILILPPLVFLISFGIIYGISLIKVKKLRMITIVLYFGTWFLSFAFYQHLYWIHNPWYSERSWQAGYKEAVDALKIYENQYEKIIFTNANDDPRIFFASYYPIDPKAWQKGFTQESVGGFGDILHFGKYYFGQVDGKVGIYNLANYLDYRTLYIAAAREIKDNLIMEPQKVPEGLNLIKAIAYPSAEPAFYFLEKSKT